MISKIKKPVSIILSVLMVVSLFTALPFTVSAATADRYFVVGSMNSWTPNDDYILSDTTNNNGEYYVEGLALHNGDEIKIAHSLDGTNIDAWYPDDADPESNYSITSDGLYSIYFQPAGNHNGWHYGYFHVDRYADIPSPTVYVAQIGNNKYETLDDAIEAAQDDQTVKLLSDITLEPKTISGESAKYGAYITKSITLDGQNHTITSNAPRAIGVKGTSGDVDVTFKDVTINNSQAGAICIITRGGIGELSLDNVKLDTQGCPSGYNQPLTIGGTQTTQAKVNVTDSVIQTNNEALNYYAIILWNPVDLTIENSTIKGWACVYQKAFDGTDAETEVKINNSTLISQGLKGSSNHFAAIMTEDEAFSCVVTNTTIDVTAAENTYQGIAASNNSADGFSVELGAGNNVTLTGDTAIIGYNFDDTNHEIAVSGGTFNKSVDEEYCAEGYIPATLDAATGTYSVKTGSYVAQIGDNKYETLEAAFAAAQDGQTITVLADCAGNGIQVPQGKYATGLTVDFGGHTYTMDGTMVGSTGTKTQAFQLLKDNTITFKNGTIYSAKAKMLVQNYSNLTLDNMTLTLNNPNYASAYTLSNNNGNVVIDDTTINANPAGRFAFDVCRYSSYPSVNVTVTGASVINGDVEVSASGSDAKDGFSLTLESGTMTGDIVVDASAQSLIGEDNKVTKANTFNKEAPEGFRWVGDGATQTLAAIPYVAQIGTTKYETLEAAFAAAQDGQTITVLADCAGNGIIVPEGKFTNGLTVDFNGHKYTVDGTILAGSTGTKTQAFQLLKNNNVTFKNGTIYSEKALMLVQNYSNLTLDGMTLDGSKLVGTGRYTLSNNNGNVVIDDTTIIAKEGNNFAFDVCRYSSYPSVHVTVTGESVINGDVEISASGSNAREGFSLTLESGTMTGDIVVDASAQSLIGEDNKVTKANTFNKEAPEGFRWVGDGATQTLAAIPYVAQIGTTKYETLEAAFAAAQDGQTITVLADCAGNGIQVPQGKYATGLTVDFGGHTYTMDGTMVGSTGTKTQAFQLLKDNTITFKNGTIYSAKAKMLVQNYSNLTLDNMTLTLNNPNYASAYTLSNNNGNVVIDDTTINANPAGGFAFDVCRYASYPSVNVTVTGDSVINGNIEVDASNGDAKNGFSLKLNDGTLDGTIKLTNNAKTAMDNTPAKAEVDKATSFNATAPAGYMWVADGEGTQTLAKAVAQIDETPYATLEAAFAAAHDGDTITVLADCSGNGIQVLPNRFNTNGLTVDFDGHTYTMDGTLVGSTGTQTQAFQLQKNNKITLKDGTITSNKAKMLINNYCDLTLDGMTLTLDNPNYASGYTLSDNNGNVLIKDTTINANPAGKFAFDVCRGGGGDTAYLSVYVTVTGNSVINGDVEIDAKSGNARDGFGLTLQSGTMTGDIKLTNNAKTAITNTPDKAQVTKANTFTQTAPAGFKWVDNGNGTSTLSPKYFAGRSITLEGNIELNFWVDNNNAKIDTADSAKVVFTWDNGASTAEVNLKNVTDIRDNRYYIAPVSLVAAHVASTVKGELYINGTKVDEANYSVKEYAELLIAHPEYDNRGKPDEMVALAKALLHYGAEAQTVLTSAVHETLDRADSNIEAPNYSGVTTSAIQSAIEAANNGAAGDDLMHLVFPDVKVYTYSVIYLSENTLRIYFQPKEGNTMTNTADFDGHSPNSQTFYYVEETSIAANDLATLKEFSVHGVDFKFSALDYAKSVVGSSRMSDTQKNLAKALFQYNQAAIDYLGYPVAESD